jgi:hypothetical protein
MFTLFTLALALSAVLSGAQTSASRVLYRTGFEEEASLKVWGDLPAGVRLDRLPDGTKALRVEREGEGLEGSVMLRMPLPLDQVRGRRLQIEARLRAEGVAKPPNVWNGVKLMLHFVSPGGPRWEQINGIHGTFDWRTLRFIRRIPADASEAWLMIGLELTHGRVWFDDLSVTLRSDPTAKRTGKAPYKGHSLPRLRGVMIGMQVGAEDLRELGNVWKANHVRWQLTWGGFPQSPADTADLSAYEAWLESELKRLDALLPVCKEAGILVLIDLHTPPGGRDQASACRIFQERRFQDKFLEIWDRIAKRYRDHPAVWGFDLVNEPVEGGMVAEGLLNWQSLAQTTAKRIHAIAPKKAMVVEPADWGGPSALENFEPLDVPNVVYSVHMYEPHRFTHQGVYDAHVGLTYPGVIDNVRWDRAQLRRALEPVVAFQRDYGVHIYIGEFSAIRWAPGTSAHDYLRDLIEIMEENGWDWAYHAFREWHGWSVEHGSSREDAAPSPTPTDRARLLRSWFARNRKPSF